MGINRELLYRWINDSTNNATKPIEFPEEGWLEAHDRYYAEYYAKIDRRIQYCARLLKKNPDWLVYYTLAKLYEGGNPNDGRPGICSNLRKSAVCVRKAILKNPRCAEGWDLLAGIYRFWSLTGGHKQVVVSMDITNIGNCSSKEAKKKKIPFVDNQKVIDPNLPEIKFAEKSIACALKAVAIEPNNLEYKNTLTICLDNRDRQYKFC